MQTVPFQESAPPPLSPESLADGKTSARARQKGARPYRLPLRIGPIRPSARGARADAKVKTEGAEANFFGDKNRQFHHDGRSSRPDTGRHWGRNRARHPLSRTDSPPVPAVGGPARRVTVSEAGSPSDIFLSCRGAQQPSTTRRHDFNLRLRAGGRTPFLALRGRR